MDNSKKPWQSKTLWANLVLAVAAFFPQVQAYVSAHPMLMPEVFFGVNMVLRMVSKDQISLQD